MFCSIDQVQQERAEYAKLIRELEEQTEHMKRVILRKDEELHELKRREANSQEPKMQA